jgi:hypothetical protein
LNAPITQENLPLANERVRVGSFPGSLQTSFQFAFHHSLGTAGVFDNLVGEHIPKLYARGKR